MKTQKSHGIRKSFTNKKELLKHFLDVDSDLEEYILETTPKKQSSITTVVHSFLPVTAAVDIYQSETQLKKPISSWIDQAKTGSISFETQFPWLRPSSGNSGVMNPHRKTIQLKTYQIQKLWVVVKSEFDSAIDLVREKCKQQKSYKKPESPKCLNCKSKLGNNSDPNAYSQRYFSLCKHCHEGCTLYVKDNTPGYKSSDDYPCCKCKKMPQ